MRDTDSPQWLNTCNLMEPLGLLHGNDVDSVDDWTCSPIAGGAGEAIGVYRVTGSAAIDGADTPFSVILKGWSSPNAISDPSSWDWSQRERLAYASGVLDNLPGGIHAPRCLGMMTGPDGSEWVWLSSMSEGATASWNLKHFASVARHLGRFNGAYLTGNPVPDAQWLSHQ